MAPAGVRLYLPIAAGSGKVLRDLSARLGDLSFVGTPAWQTGLYGPQLGGYSTSNYAALTLTPAIVVSSLYPFWMATLAINADSATQGQSLGLGNSSTSRFCLITYNRSGANNLAYEFRDDAGTSATAQSIGLTASSDGLPHVAMVVSYSASDHRIYFDGNQVGSTTTTLGTATYDRLAVGVMLRATAANAFAGSVIAAAMGNGAIPNPMALAADWLAGRFAAVRPRRPAPWMMTSAAATKVPWHHFFSRAV